MAKILHHISLKILTLTACVALLAATAHALPADAYAPNSRLAEGRWVKVAVNATGLHRITPAQMRDWGFKDPSAVKVFGYGGARISDILDATTYIDDLPAAPQAREENGSIVFYAQGPVTWIGPAKDGFFHHQLNPYNTCGYYYLTDALADVATEMPREGLDAAQGRTFATTFTETLWLEDDMTSPGESGHLLVGDDFRFTPSRNYRFRLPGRVEGHNVETRINFFTRVPSASPHLRVSVGDKLVGSYPLSRTTTSSYGDSTIVRSSFDLKGDVLDLSLAFNASTTVLVANLDKISVNYTRSLSLDGGTLVFATTESALSLGGTTEATVVWDVTDITRPTALNTVFKDGNTRWVSEYSGLRRYAAWTPSTSSLPSPIFSSTVANQDIHAMPTPDMVIFTPRAWMDQAERVADIHRAAPDNMRVAVLDQQQVYNEFGSGSPDVNALRRCLKMFSDRPAATDEDGRNHSLQYALLMGRPTFDHRHLTQYMATNGYDHVPMWQTDGGSDESTSFGTDDFLGMLEDGSGADLSRGVMTIAVGRMPVRDAVAARAAVDKLRNYIYKSPVGDWKNRHIFLADDQDNGVHLDQAEAMVATLNSAPDGPDFVYNKVYIDAFEKTGGVTVEARDRMFKWLNEGAAWWTYIGHASIDSWTGEGMLRRNDIVNNLFYRRLPILYAATCSFQRWDGADVSGSEMMVANTSGGAIASICPTRPVYISQNGLFTKSIASHMYARGDDGRYLTIGEILRRAKNGLGRDSNKLRYVLNGDPALRVPTPQNNIVVERINGIAVDDPDAQPTVMALQQALFEGYVADPKTGHILDDFDGSLYVTLYDAEKSVTTLGRGTPDDPGKEAVFEEQGLKLYAGRDSIRAGRFAIRVAMPSEISWNFRPAAFNMYATEDGGDSREAMGCSRNFYVYGYDESAAADKTAPVIEALYLNHESFKDGDTVNESPMVFATVSDDIGINLSQTGIGHSLLIRLDDNDSYTDVTDFYTPSPDGSPSGLIGYPLENLAAGNHSLTLRVCDTSSNFAQASIDFYVQPGLTPKIFDIRATPNPASTQADFYITHNRPDIAVNVVIRVYDLRGRELWSASQTSRSDMFTTTPISWDLRDRAGNRVPRGIYLYRAELSTDGEHHATETKRLAVTGH